VTVLGRGDLSPRRKPRRRGRRWWLLLLLVTLAVVGWFGRQALRGDNTSSLRTGNVPCVQPTHPPAPADPSAVHVRVLNGTNRAGLAHEVADQLHRRGFRLAGVGNAPHVVAATTVQHPEAELAAALAVAEQLRAAEVGAAKVRVVTLTIGRDFHGLAPKQLASRQHVGDLRSASPSPSPCPSSPG
jgi:hypothetical protein